MKKVWSWLGKTENHNVLMILITVMAVILALPIFNRLNVQINALQQSIEGLYGQYTRETFCSELKDKFGNNNVGQRVVFIKLKYIPIPNSISVWEGAMNISPIYFSVQGDTIAVEGNWTPEIIEQECSGGAIGAYVVTYIPQNKEI